MTSNYLVRMTSNCIVRMTSNYIVSMTSNDRVYNRSCEMHATCNYIHAHVQQPF